MSNATAITFTSEEQIQLTGLNDNLRKFKNLLILLQTNLFKGADAEAVMDSMQIAQALCNQTQQALVEIEKQARIRMAEPVKEKLEPAKVVNG